VTLENGGRQKFIGPWTNVKLYVLVWRMTPCAGSSEAEDPSWIVHDIKVRLSECSRSCRALVGVVHVRAIAAQLAGHICLRLLKAAQQCGGLIALSVCTGKLSIPTHVSGARGQVRVCPPVYDLINWVTLVNAYEGAHTEDSIPLYSLRMLIALFTLWHSYDLRTHPLAYGSGRCLDNNTDSR
jgi:hypothetical protein